MVQNIQLFGPREGITGRYIISSIGQLGSGQGTLHPLQVLNGEYAKRNRIEHKTNITMCFNFILYIPNNPINDNIQNKIK